MSKNQVAIKDMDRDIEIMRLSLACTDIYLDYQGVELLLTVLAKVKLKGGKFDLNDAAKIKSEWTNKWEKYFDELNPVKEK